MKQSTFFLIVVILFSFVAYFFYQEQMRGTDGEIHDESHENVEITEGFEVLPITHASLQLNWDGLVIYADPAQGNYDGRPQGDLILLTDIHGDHLQPDVIETISRDETLIVSPQAVYDELTTEMQARTTVMGNGEKISLLGFTIEAIPMYNLPESDESYHVKGRGNGYVLEKEGRRVYISGDTGPIDEMRALEDIDVAFVSMNLPYTMTVEEAADAVIDFAPAEIYPYHYRGPDGLSDVGQFEALVNQGNPEIQVVKRNWYPEQE